MLNHVFCIKLAALALHAADANKINAFQASNPSAELYRSIFGRKPHLAETRCLYKHRSTLPRQRRNKWESENDTILLGSLSHSIFSTPKSPGPMGAKVCHGIGWSLARERGALLCLQFSSSLLNTRAAPACLQTSNRPEATPQAVDVVIKDVIRVI